MTPSDVETLERATLAAVSPETVDEAHGWLIPFEHGSVSRASSAVPLAHAPVDEAVIDDIEVRYRARGIAPVFRIAAKPCFHQLHQTLARRGYAAGRAVLVQVADARVMRQVSAQVPAETATAPDAGWAALFLGEGFDPVDGAHRVKLLSRAKGTLFASVREGGQTVAAGAGAFSHGWASVHGMRTDIRHRGKGLAGRVLAGIADAALSQGLSRVFLQVEEVNTTAQALYRRAGFETVWRYEYWRQG